MRPVQLSLPLCHQPFLSRLSLEQCTVMTYVLSTGLVVSVRRTWGARSMAGMPFPPYQAAAAYLTILLALSTGVAEGLYGHAGNQPSSLRSLLSVVAAQNLSGVESAPAPGAVPAPPAVVPLLAPSMSPLGSLPYQSNTPALNGTSAAIEAANTVDTSYCGLSNCGLTGPGSCQDYTSNNAAQLGFLNYLQYTTVPCGTGNYFTQYRCCAQVCDLDSDCPSSYYCQSGYTSGLKYCKACAACGSTTVQKCRSDQNCPYPSCLSQDGASCGYANSASSIVISPDACCPSNPSGFQGCPHGIQSCTCTTAQTCLVPPPPPSSPPQASSYPSCLSQDGTSCGYTNSFSSIVISPDACCPSAPSSFQGCPNGIQSCTCGSAQTCPVPPSPPPPPPPPSPSTSHSPPTPSGLPSSPPSTSSHPQDTPGSQSPSSAAGSCFPASAVVQTPNRSNENEQSEHRRQGVQLYLAKHASNNKGTLVQMHCNSSFLCQQIPR